MPAEGRPAGDFSAWLGDLRAAVRGERDSEVPCDGCTACCTSSQFVHVGPEETDTLDHVPPDLLVPAPGLARGHMILGYDSRGHCPLLVDQRCSIYEHRPRACRTYDCRVFAAAGVLPEDDKPLIAERAHQWTFTYPGPSDRVDEAAVRAAAGHLQAEPGSRGTRATRPSATVVAVRAAEISDQFVGKDAPTASTKGDTAR